MRVRQTSHTVAVRAHKRALDIRKEAWSRWRAFVIAEGGTIVTDVTGDVAKRCVEADGETLTERDVRIESDVQTTHVIVLQCTLLVDIAYGEVIVGHSVTAFHIDTIVLGHGRVVHQVLPVGILVVLGVIIVGRILVEELKRTVAGVGGLQHLRGIASVLLSIHN